MSNINNGELRDMLNHVVIDLFEPEREKWDTVTSFFLTHAHTDHLNGIYWSGETFLDNLVARNQKHPNRYKFYMHKYAFSHLKFHLRRIGTRGEARLNALDVLFKSGVIMFLEVNQRYQVHKGDKCKDLWVTPLSAGHCVGSLMFYFQCYTEKQEPVKMLYTGDCRIHQRDMRILSLVVDTKVDVLYIDTTFFTSQAAHMQFPSRRTVMGNIKNFIELRRGTASFDLCMAGHLTQMDVAVCLYNEFSTQLSVGQHEQVFCQEIEPFRQLSTHNEIGHRPIGSLNLNSNNKWWELPDEPYRFYIILRASEAQVVGTKNVFSFSTHLSNNEVLRVINFFQPAVVIPLCVREGQSGTELETQMTRDLASYLHQAPEEPEEFSEVFSSSFHDFTTNEYPDL